MSGFGFICRLLRGTKAPMTNTDGWTELTTDGEQIWMDVDMR